MTLICMYIKGDVHRRCIKGDVYRRRIDSKRGVYYRVDLLYMYVPYVYVCMSCVYIYTGGCMLGWTKRVGIYVKV